MATQLVKDEIIQRCLGLSSDLIKLPASHIWVDYDKEADVLYLSFRKPQKAKKTVETDDDVLIRTDGNEIVGMTMLNASSRENAGEKSSCVGRIQCLPLSNGVLSGKFNRASTH